MRLRSPVLTGGAPRICTQMQTNLLTTDHVRPAERAGYWSDIIWRSFGKLRSDTWGDENFNGSIAQREYGDVHVARLQASRHRVVRKAGAKGASDPGYLKLVVQHRGYSVFEQDGRRAELAPGSWSLYETTRSYTVSSPDTVKLDVVLLPRAAVLRGAGGLERMFVRCLPADSGMSRIACSLIRSSAEDHTHQRLSDAERGRDIVRLVRLALLEQAGGPVPVSPRWLLLERIKAHIDQRLADPALDADAIARELNCSKRSLHKAFEAETCSLHQHIWAQRLERVRRDLENSARDTRSITEIAFAWGFSSPEHFSRIFRARYGLSPREWRMHRSSP
jgi:AraC-like DNA-binding protein